MKKNTLFLIPAVFGLFLSSCGGGGTPGGTPPKDFEGISFENVTVDYDGNEHQLGDVVGEVPEGTDVTYQNRDPKVDVGIYTATATLSKEGYNNLTLTATLTINAIDFSGVTYESKTINYDGSDHIGAVQLSGTLPTGTTTATEVKDKDGNKVTEAINVGEYSYTCTLTNKNYKTKTFTATLTISPIDFSDVTFEDKIVTYDGSDHIGDVQVVGFLPEGTTTEIEVKDKDGNKVTEVINVGEYSYTCTLENKNYNTKTLTATLTIAEAKQDRFVFTDSSGNVFFTNGLHNDYLYSYKGEDGELKLADYSTVKAFTKQNHNDVLYVTKSLISNSAKSASLDGVNTIYSEGNITSIAKYNDSTYYVSINGLTLAKSGIYRIDLVENDEPVVTRVANYKTKNLLIYGDFLFYINESENSYLYRYSFLNYENECINSTYKIREMTLANSKLYLSIDGLLNDSIGVAQVNTYNITVSIATNAAGEYLTGYGSSLYFYYTDFYSVIDQSKKGIWKINNSGVSEKVLSIDGVLGFDVYSTSIYYVKGDNLHLYRYDMSTKETTDLLDGFVPPEETPVNLGGKTISKGNKIYYLNMFANKTLYVYDESRNTNTQLTSNKVEDFTISGNTLYFNQESLLGNNDVYSVDLTVGGAANKITTNDLRSLYVSGNYIYGTHYNFTGLAGGIARMNLDGSEYVKFSEVNGAKNYSIRDDRLYYINCGTGQDNGYIEYIETSSITPTSSKLTGIKLSNNIKNVKQFEFDGNNIFYIYNGLINNSIRRTDFTSLAAGTEIASSKTNPTEFILSGEYVYYYSYATSSVSDAGFYKVSKTATEDGTQELILGYSSAYYATSLSLAESGNLYFLNYIPKLALGDAHFYQLNLSNKTVLKIN